MPSLASSLGLGRSRKTSMMWMGMWMRMSMGMAICNFHDHAIPILIFVVWGAHGPRARHKVTSINAIRKGNDAISANLPTQCHMIDVWPCAIQWEFRLGPWGGFEALCAWRPWYAHGTPRGHTKSQYSHTRASRFAAARRCSYPHD